jgi:hypothetical protein
MWIPRLYLRQIIIGSAQQLQQALRDGAGDGLGKSGVLSVAIAGHKKLAEGRRIGLAT